MSKPKLAMKKSMKSSINFKSATQSPLGKITNKQMTETINPLNTQEIILTQKKEDFFFNEVDIKEIPMIEMQMKKDEKESLGEGGGGAQEVLKFFK